MNTDDLLAFSFIDGVGEKTLEKISAYSSLEELWNESNEKLITVFQSGKALSEFRNCFGRYKEKLTKIKRRLRSESAVIISKNDSLYPERLKSSRKSPLFLYCRGNTGLLNSPSTAAISGPRKTSDEVLDRAFYTARTLASENTTVVSGLALGVDAEAHKAAIENGSTIAVLPYFTPIYPPQNQVIAERILLRNSLIIAEYFEPFNVKFQLLNRDRIITGLADRLYVPQRFEEDSGTGYTVRCMAEENKPIFIFTSGKFIRYN